MQDLFKRYGHLLPNIEKEMLEREMSIIIESHKAGSKYGQQLQVEARREGKFPKKMDAEKYYTDTFSSK